MWLLDVLTWWCAPAAPAPDPLVGEVHALARRVDTLARATDAAVASALDRLDAAATRERELQRVVEHLTADVRAVETRLRFGQAPRPKKGTKR